MTLKDLWTEMANEPDRDRRCHLWHTSKHSRLVLDATDAEIAEIVDRCHLVLKLGKEGHRLWKAEIPYQIATMVLLTLLNFERLTETQIEATAKITFLSDEIIRCFFLSHHLTVGAATAFTVSNPIPLTTQLYEGYVSKLDVLDLFNQG